MDPSVSCIMPCGLGDKYVGTAIQCFLDQTYRGRLELVIVDNNEGEVKFGVNAPADLDQERVSVKYVRSKRMPVGALRNLGIKHATGDVICIWDEDDFSSDDRVAGQVKRLQESGKAVTGWHNVNYFDEETGGTFKYHYSPSRAHEPYAIGASHCFLKSWWEKHPYVEQGVEDKIFSDEAMHAGQLDSCDAGHLYVARIHSNNVIRKNQYLGRHKQWPAVERSTFPQGFFEAIGSKAVKAHPPMAAKE
jgi:glycosyltransferase involved in cell wall biosynthesis